MVERVYLSVVIKAELEIETSVESNLLVSILGVGTYIEATRCAMKGYQTTIGPEEIIILLIELVFNPRSMPANLQRTILFIYRSNGQLKRIENHNL